MKSREKKLGLLTGAAVVLLVGYLVVDRAFLAPARRFSDKSEGLKKSISEMKVGNELLKRRAREMFGFRQHTYADSTLHAGVLISKRLGEIAARAGLGQRDVTISNFSGSGAAGGDFREAGCTVSGQTTLERLTNLLFLLRQDAYPHRVTNLEINPERGDLVRFGFRYVSPVLEGDPPAILGSLPPVSTQPKDIPDLSDLARADYDVIPRRDFFKPYMPPAPPVVIVTPPTTRPEVKPSTPTVTPTVRPSSGDQLVVLGLSSIRGQPEILIGRPGEDVQKTYAIGDKLEFGEIVMVDARPLPDPSKPDEISFSRMIVKAGNDYWAVELDHAIGRRRVLKPNELPEELKATSEDTPAPETRPAKAP